MAIAYIGVGSNLGNREDNCLKAIKLLSDKGITVRKQSSLYETEPWGVKDQPWFINTVIEIETAIEPEELLQMLKEVERDIGRVDTYRWGPRVIDLDILLYNDLVMDTPHLKIPHPLIHERDFVLRPLSEIAPDKTHPVLKKTIKELLSELMPS
ncbi:MAG: 2-amino-4-hydroxy-6-hydroxymethyldihydropteridine diphosphokinase [Thermodesulfovibrionales bacterium]